MKFRWALLPDGLHERVELRRDAQGLIQHIGPAHGHCIEGLVLPRLVNAHTHLELSGLRPPGGQGLPEWVSGLLSLIRERSAQEQQLAIARAVQQLQDSGTASLGEVTNTRDSDAALAASPLTGAVYQELLGIAPAQVDIALTQVRGPAPNGFVLQAVPHAPYSCSPELITTALRSPTLCGSAWPTIHLDEDPAERQFLMTGTGPWAELLDLLGRDRSANVAPRCTPVQYLRRLGVLGQAALVHCTLTRGEDLDAIAEAGSPVVLCPSSNLHIGGALPDVMGLVERGIVLALGTDSQASAQSLDVLDEVALLARRFPQVPLSTWLLAATAGGGEVVGRAVRLEVGVNTPLLLLTGGPGEWLSGERRLLE